jgi:hypothetical protein
MMGEEILTVGAALRTINQASHHALASFTLELYEANHVISKALLGKHHSLNTVEGHCSTTTVNEELVQTPTQSENQNRLHMEAWPSRSDTALVNLAEYWLHIRAIHLKYSGGRGDLPVIIRKAMISNSPAVLSLLRKFLAKRKRSA